MREKPTGERKHLHQGAVMTAYFRCPACDAPHPSRLRAANEATLATVMREIGNVLERCPTTGTWVQVGVAEVTAREVSSPTAE